MLTEITMKLKDVHCEWFALCPNVATDTRWHPIVGDVPVCDECAKRVDAGRGAA